ncbi:hypothetical protein WJX72_002636 [[Myrmecia] bisecta]|uniref:Enoyl reductase (ER) domain-containing protein n=1 Tax=[Myrmecia] bisecta TaxID=41462 RepID=A0AAW1PX11_9CHLO
MLPTETSQPDNATKPAGTGGRIQGTCRDVNATQRLVVECPAIAIVTVSSLMNRTTLLDLPSKSAKVAVNDTDTATSDCQENARHFRAWAFHEKGAQLEPFEYDAQLGPNDLELKILANGLCHSDLSMRDNKWGITTYPLVPGHEVVGKVTGVGSAVKRIKEGDVVGYGWNTDCCGHCNKCTKGDDNLCVEGAQATIVGNHGGFGDYMIAPSTLAIKIPESMSPADAAPLLCAGVTVWSPISEHVQCGMKVGIVGLGGLGHLALQFAAAKGAEVYAISNNKGKEKEARGFGAKHFVSPDDLSKDLAGSLDVLISSAPEGQDYNALVGAVAPGGKFILLSGHLDKLDIPIASLIMGQKSVHGSLVGGMRMMQEMLQVAAMHNIKPLVEKMPMSKCNEALQRLIDGKARYRIVLTPDEQ